MAEPLPRNAAAVYAFSRVAHDFGNDALQPVVVGDLDGDGRPEVVAAGVGSGPSYHFTTIALVRRAGGPHGGAAM